MAALRIPGLVLTDHMFTVPLDHAQPTGPTIEVYAREVTKPRGSDDLPWLVFLQGGPGFEATRPTGSSGWLGRAIDDYRVLLLDQRGTGRSTPVRAQTVGHLPDADLAEYLTHFRADTIVEDAEFIRRTLTGDRPWSILGQSFGGFCATTYLSRHPEGLAEAFITGGLPPLHAPPSAFYRRTFARMERRSDEFYERFPDDDAIVRRLVEVLAGEEVRCPDGTRLTPRRLQQFGDLLGQSEGFEELHYVIESAFIDTADGPRIATGFIQRAWQDEPYLDHPLYAVLHEACLANGVATNWAAQQVRDERPQFEPAADRPVLLLGEGIFPWMFEELGALRPFAGAAEILARHEWPLLYDSDALDANTVPCAAAMYYDDHYVERSFSEETAEAIRGLRVWVTNEYEHNGLRADGAAILDRLIAMARGER